MKSLAYACAKADSYVRHVARVGLLLLPIGLASPALAAATAPSITPGIYEVSFWLTQTSSTCAIVVTPSNYYADLFNMAVPGSGQSGAVEYYSLASDEYTIKHVIDYPPVPAAGETLWKGHIIDDPFEEGTRAGTVTINLKSITPYVILATGHYHGNYPDGATCDVDANLAFELKGALP